MYDTHDDAKGRILRLRPGQDFHHTGCAMKSISSGLLLVVLCSQVAPAVSADGADGPSKLETMAFIAEFLPRCDERIYDIGLDPDDSFTFRKKKDNGTNESNEYRIDATYGYYPKVFGDGLVIYCNSGDCITIKRYPGSRESDKSVSRVGFNCDFWTGVRLENAFKHLVKVSKQPKKQPF